MGTPAGRTGNTPAASQPRSAAATTGASCAVVSGATGAPAGATPAATWALVPAMVTVVVEAPMVAPAVGLESTTVKFLFTLPVARPRIVTVTVWLVMLPAANVRVVEAALKSVPATAVPLTVFTVAPTAFGDDPDTETVNVIVWLLVEP